MKFKRSRPVVQPRLVVLFDSWVARCKHRKTLKAFNEAVDRAIKTDAILMELAKLKKRRINEILIEVGENHDRQ